MSDLHINIRFGTVHWQIGRNWPWLRVSRNGYWVENAPGIKDWFKVYKFFGYTAW